MSPFIAQLVQILTAFGVPIIAFLVYHHNKSESGRAAVRAERLQQIELNKFNLSLLDRRIKVIQEFERSAWLDFQDPEYELHLDRLKNCSNLGQVLFNEKVASDVLEVRSLLIKIRSAERNVDRAHKHESENITDLQDRADNVSSKLYDLRNSVLSQMYRQSTITELR